MEKNNCEVKIENVKYMKFSLDSIGNVSNEITIKNINFINKLRDYNEKI